MRSEYGVPTETLERQPQPLTFLEEQLLERRHTDLSGLPPNRQCNLITSRAASVVLPDDLQILLQQAQTHDKPLKIKFGIDPTGADLHLGHAVSVVVLDRMRRMGHEVVFVIGDVTATIGDPSGRSTARPLLDEEQVRQNALTYMDQIRPFFDPNHAEVRRNSEWLGRYTLMDLLRMGRGINVLERLRREDFQRRIAAGGSVSVTEVLYAHLMALDSAELESDIEVGGIDQLLNFHTCRTFMKQQGMIAETVVATPLLPGTTDGSEKMSKSRGNYIGLTQSPEEIFARMMSIADALPDTPGAKPLGRIEMYLKSLTEITNEEWAFLERGVNEGTIHPMDVKKMLGRIIVSVIHGPQAAQEAQHVFETKHQGQDLTQLDDLASVSLTPGQPQTVLDVVFNLGFAASRSEVRRLAQGHGIRIVDQGHNVVMIVEDPTHDLSGLPLTEGPLYIQVGKRKFARLNTG